MTEKHHTSPNLNYSDEIPTDKNRVNFTPKVKTSHPCSTCNKTFMSPVHLMQHIAAKHPITDIAADSNRAAARYGCHACKKTFKSPVDLAQHTQIKHSQDKTEESTPMNNECNLGLHGLDTLSQHCISLNQNNPSSEPISTNFFPKLCEDVQYMGEMNDSTPLSTATDYECPSCEMTFTTVLSLAEHMRTKHQANPKPEEEIHPTDKFTPDINNSISSTATITEHTKKVHGAEAILNNSAPPSHCSSTATITEHTKKVHGAEAILHNSAPPSHCSSTATITEHTEKVHGAEAILNNSAPPSHCSSTATITEHTEKVHGAEAILNNSAPPSHCSSTATITEHTEKVHGAEAILNNSAPPSHCSSTATITEHTEKVHGAEAILNNSAPPSHWSSTATITEHTEKAHGAEAILNNSAPPSHCSSTATITEHTEKVHGAEAILNNSAPPSHCSSTATITEHTEKVHGAEAILNNSAPPSHWLSSATITEHTKKVHGAEAILNNSAPPSHWSSTATITEHTEKVHGAEAILNNSAGSHHLGDHQRTMFKLARSSGASVAEQVENEYLWDSAISDSVLTEDLPVYQCSLCPLAFLRQTQLLQHSKENHCTDNCKPDANNSDMNHLKGNHCIVKCRPDANKTTTNHLIENHHTVKYRPSANNSDIIHLKENHLRAKYRPSANNSDMNHLKGNHLRAKCRPDANKSNVNHLKKNHCTDKCRSDAKKTTTNHLKKNHRTDKPRSDINNNDTHHLKNKHAADRTEHTKKKRHRETGLKYQCPHCPQAFTLRVHLMQHDRDKHSQDNHQVTGLKGVSTATAHKGDERLREKSGADSTRKVKTSNSHLCSKCSKTFKSVIDLMQHQRAKHHIRGIAALTSLESLSLHMTEKHHTSPNLNHSDENPTDKNSGDLTPKVKTSHPCSTCNKTFMSPVHLMQHIAAKHPITDIAADSNRAAARYGCHACKKTFQSPVFLAQHIQMKHPKHKTKESSPRKNENCQNSKCMRLPVVGHVRCCLCGKTRLAGQEWEDHCRRRHPDWKCCQCGEAYRNQISLDGHKNLKCACGTRSCKVLAPAHAKICKLSAKLAEHVQGNKRPREEDYQGPMARKRKILLHYRDNSCD